MSNKAAVRRVLSNAGFRVYLWEKKRAYEGDHGLSTQDYYFAMAVRR